MENLENLDPDLYPEEELLDSAFKPLRILNIAYTYFLNQVLLVLGFS